MTVSFTSPELTPSSNPKTCNICGIHVNNARAMSWENNTCPRCYVLKEEKQDNSNPLDTVVNCIIVTPMTVYLNRYTSFEMMRMKK